MMLPKSSKLFLSVAFVGILGAMLLFMLTAFASTLAEQKVFLPSVLNQYPPPPSNTTKLLITELMYNPAAEPAGEWVEIYNPGNVPAALSAYKLGDEETYGSEEGMFKFPAETILKPAEVIVVANKGLTFRSLFGFPPDFEMRDTDPTIPDMLLYHAWSSGQIELINAGDEILLLDGDDNLVDALSWGNSTWELALDPPPPPAGDGQSLERSPAYMDSDSAADWRLALTPNPYQLDLSTPTPALSPTPEIPTGPTILLISEVLYDPSGDDPAGEWIELYNAGENNAALWLFRLGDEETQGNSEGMYFFPPGSVLLAGETAVIARDALTFEILYGFKADFEISDLDPAVPNLSKDSTWATGSLNLSASGDEVLLLDQANTWIEGVSWGDSKVILNPSVPKVAQDHSIERYPPGSDSDSASDWRDQPNPLPGQIDLSTPTPMPSPTATTTPTPLPDLIINEIHADPAGDLSGDANGDGVRETYEDEFLEIVNTTNAAIDVSGWTLSDSDTIRHTFPISTTVQAGCAIIIFGGGTPVGDFGGSEVQVASSGKLYLNNDGDTLTLREDGNTIIDWHLYGANAGDDQSITRDPDITGPNPMVKHSLAIGSGGALFSPGTRVDRTFFTGCPTGAVLKSLPTNWQR